MLAWALSFLLLAMVCAVFGFGGIAPGAEGIGQVLFFFFLAAFVTSVIVALSSGSHRYPSDR